MSQIWAGVKFLSNNNHRDHHPGDLRGQALGVDGLEVYLVGFCLEIWVAIVMAVISMAYATPWQPWTW